jgi:flagellar basal body-associated protein FliL
LENKGTIMILLVIIAVLALSLAVSLGYIFIVSGNNQGNSYDTDSNTEVEKVPDIDELESKYLFEEDKYFNLKPDSGAKSNIICVGIELVYYKKVDKVKDVALLIESYDGAIKEMVGSYFQNMTFEQAKIGQTKIESKQALKDQINELLNKGVKEKDKQEVIYMVNFSNWLYQ